MHQLIFDPASRLVPALCLLTLISVVLARDISPTSQPVTRSEVIGIYVANYHAGLAEAIELREDSTYIYNFVATDSSESTIRDRWTFGFDRGRADYPYVVLRNFVTPYSLVGTCYRTTGPAELLRREIAPRDYAIDVFKEKNGQISLERCPNDNQYYVKQQPRKG